MIYELERDDGQTITVEYSVTKGYPGFHDRFGCPESPPEPPELIINSATDNATNAQLRD